MYKPAALGSAPGKFFADGASVVGLVGPWSRLLWLDPRARRLMTAS